MAARGASAGALEGQERRGGLREGHVKGHAEPERKTEPESKGVHRADGERGTCSPKSRSTESAAGLPPEDRLQRSAASKVMAVALASASAPPGPSKRKALSSERSSKSIVSWASFSVSTREKERPLGAAQTLKA